MGCHIQGFQEKLYSFKNKIYFLSRTVSSLDESPLFPELSYDIFLVQYYFVVQHNHIDSFLGERGDDGGVLTILFICIVFTLVDSSAVPNQ